MIFISIFKMFLFFKQYDHWGGGGGASHLKKKKSNSTLFAGGVFQMILEDDALTNP